MTLILHLILLIFVIFVIYLIFDYFANQLTVQSFLELIVMTRRNQTRRNHLHENDCIHVIHGSLQRSLWLRRCACR